MWCGLCSEMQTQHRVGIWSNLNVNDHHHPLKRGASHFCSHVPFPVWRQSVLRSCLWASSALFSLKPWLEIPVTITILPVPTKTGCSQRGSATCSTHARTHAPEVRLKHSQCSKLCFWVQRKKDWVCNRERKKACEKERERNSSVQPPTFSRTPQRSGRPAHSWDHNSLSMGCQGCFIMRLKTIRTPMNPLRQGMGKHSHSLLAFLWVWTSLQTLEVNSKFNIGLQVPVDVWLWTGDNILCFGAENRASEVRHGSLALTEGSQRIRKELTEMFYNRGSLESWSRNKDRRRQIVVTIKTSVWSDRLTDSNKKC